MGDNNKRIKCQYADLFHIDFCHCRMQPSPLIFNYLLCTHGKQKPKKVLATCILYHAKKIFIHHRVSSSISLAGIKWALSVNIQLMFLYVNYFL